MTAERLVTYLKFMDATNLVEVVMGTKLPVQYLGGGAYRDAFKLDSKYVLKIPYRGLPRNKTHARSEIRAIAIAEGKSYNKIRKHLPKIYFTDKKTGVILMKHYKPVPRNLDSACQKLGSKLGKVFDVISWDYHRENFGMDGKNIVVLDLGLLA